MNLTNALGWTLIHFLWQGALIALLFAGSLAFLKKADSRIRYTAGCAAMMLMLISASLTFSALLMTEEPIAAILSRTATASPDSNLLAAQPATSSRSSSEGSLESIVASYIPALLWVWFSGVVALSVRSLGGWIVAERYARRQTSPAEAIWRERFVVLAERLRISKPVRLAISARAQAPTVVGWLRPIVLIPAGLFTGLTAEQVEALLAHELAHVRRHDYLVNLLQTAAETLFFYHPAVWWVNRIIRSERENCCDDLAVKACGNVLTYARALADLEELRCRVPHLVMAADGGSLLARIQRLLGKGAGTQSVMSSSLLVVLAIALLATLLSIGSVLAQRPQTGANANPSAEPSNLLVQQRLTQSNAVTQPPAQQPADLISATQVKEKKSSGSWLNQIEAAGFGNLGIEELIRLKSHGIDGDYIWQTRAAGYELSLDDLVRFRSHGIDEDFITEMKQVGLDDLSADDLIRLRSHGADGAWIKEIQSLGFPKLSLDDVIRLRSRGIDPDYIREAQKRFKRHHTRSVDHVAFTRDSLIKRGEADEKNDPHSHSCPFEGSQLSATNSAGATGSAGYDRGFAHSRQSR